MRARTALLLFAAALAVCAAAVSLLGAADRGRSSLAAGEPAFPGLVARLPEADRIEIVHKGRSLTLRRQGQGWSVPDHAGYPVQPSGLHALFTDLTALRLLEPRTADPDLFARLGVDDPSVEAASGTAVRVLANDGAAIMGLIVGHARIAGAGASARQDLYVRRPAETQAWLASGPLALSPDWSDWVARDIIDVRPDDVQGIVSRRAGGPRLEATRGGEHLALTAPAEHPRIDAYKVDDMGRALASLTLLDVRTADQAPGAPIGEATITTRQGLALTARVFKAGQDVWLTLSARGDGAAKEQAAALESRLSGWVFQVDRWKEAALVPSIADLAAFEAKPGAK